VFTPNLEKFIRSQNVQCRKLSGKQGSFWFQFIEEAEEERSTSPWALLPVVHRVMRMIYRSKI